MSKKRTILIWPSNLTKPTNPTAERWETFPLVILAKAIENQSWFNHAHLLFGRRSIEEAKQFYLSDRSTPDSLNIYQNHRGYEMKVVINWSFPERRCLIHLTKPTTETYFPFGSGVNPKWTRARFIENAMEKIQTAFAIGYPKVDTIRSEEQTQKEIERQGSLYHKNLCEKLHVDLEIGHYNNRFTYKQGASLKIAFSRVSTYPLQGKEKETFAIDDIEGKFSMEQIKQFIQIIGGSPTAIAKRLLGNQ